MSDDLCIARTHSEGGLSSNTDVYRTSPAVAPINAPSNPAAKTNDLSPIAESFSSSSASGRTPSALEQSASAPGVNDSPSEIIAAHLAEFFPQTAPNVLDSAHRLRRDVLTSSSGRTPPESASTLGIDVDVDGPPAELITAHLAEFFPHTQTAPNVVERTHHPLRDVDDEEDEEEDQEQIVEMSAAPAQNGIEWIRGALIGSGSFGSVYLGMNKVTGMLMAVKQIELPSGLSHDEERKRNTLTELQREIDLLKALQHDNIAQYLDSSFDAQYFNIFLAYVPVTKTAFARSGHIARSSQKWLHRRHFWLFLARTCGICTL